MTMVFGKTKDTIIQYDMVHLFFINDKYAWIHLMSDSRSHV